MTSTTPPIPVTIIGLGPMGRAMATTLMTAGHPVTVWNRTPARADELMAAGAARAATPTSAVAASDLVILSFTDYQAMYDILARLRPRSSPVRPWSTSARTRLPPPVPPRPGPPNGRRRSSRSG